MCQSEDVNWWFSSDSAIQLEPLGVWEMSVIGGELTGRAATVKQHPRIGWDRPAESRQQNNG